MPYVVKKVSGGYKVALASGKKMKNGRYYLSNKPLTKKNAEAQKRIVDEK